MIPIPPLLVVVNQDTEIRGEGIGETVIGIGPETETEIGGEIAWKDGRDQCQ